MAAHNPHGSMFRVIEPNRHSRVTNAELFFDLVFVFAVTQLSHALLHHFTPLGQVQVTLLFLAVWWVWVFTTWVTNWLDPDVTPVRIMLFLMMLGGLGAKHPYERALFLLVAHRAIAPSSKLECWSRWRRDGVYLPSADPVRLQDVYRCMDFFLEHKAHHDELDTEEIKR